MNALREWRKARKKTLEEMSNLIGVSMGSLSRIERGEQWPDRSVMVRIVDATGGEVTANDFVPSAAPDAGAAA